MMHDKFFTYILLLSNGKYYTGMTNCLSRRIKEHKTGQCLSTKFKLPCKLVWFNIFNSRKTARKKEVYIKNYGAKRYLKKIYLLSYGNC